MTAALPALAVTGSGLDGTSFAVAVCTDRGITALAAPREQRRDLAVLARDCLQRAGVAARDLREVRVDVGPGSYIGLRVAVTFARCTAAFAGTTLRQADSLAMAALGAATATPGSIASPACIVPVLDGRQARLQLGVFRCPAAGALQPVVAARLCPDQDLGGLLGPDDRVLALPALHPRLAAAVTAAGATLQAMPPTDAALLFAVGLPTQVVEPLALEPVYLAGSYVG